MYAQPLISIPGFQDVNTEFVEAAEFWMWIDISNITLDEVGVQLRLIEGDYNEDGTPAADQLSVCAGGRQAGVYSGRRFVEGDHHCRHGRQKASAEQMKDIRALFVSRSAPSTTPETAPISMENSIWKRIPDLVYLQFPE